MEKYFVNDIVKIIVECPSGSTESVKNKVGVITSISYEEDGANYHILCNPGCWYWYVANEFQLAIDEDVRKEFVKILINSYNNEVEEND